MASISQHNSNRDTVLELLCALQCRRLAGVRNERHKVLKVAHLQILLILVVASQYLYSSECSQTILTDDSLNIWWGTRCSICHLFALQLKQGPHHIFGNVRQFEIALQIYRRRTFTGSFQGVEQQLHMWMRCQHDDAHVRLRAMIVREPARDNIDPAHGILKGSAAWEPRIMIAVNATMTHSLTYIFPGGSQGRPHAPLLLTANVSDLTSVSGSWQVTVEDMEGLHVFDAQWCNPHRHARALNNVIALRPFLTPDLETGAILLMHHIVYHNCLGVKLHHLYVEPGQAHVLLQNCQLAHLHRAQRVVFFEWPLKQFEGTVGPDRYGGHHMSVRIQYWQMVQNNHALLTYWGTGAKVALMDIDEYFLGPVFGVSASAACMQQIQMACKGCRAGITEYVQVWSNRTTSWALKQYEVGGFSEDTVFHAKCWFSAESDVVHGVHTPTLQADNLEVYRPSIHSAGVMHFASLWSERQRSSNTKLNGTLDLNALHDEDFDMCLVESSHSPGCSYLH